MATPGGPEKVGAVSFDVNANIAPAQKNLEQVTKEAEKAGEEAGKAFKQGVEKGSEGTKWAGEGGDSFVGPPRPTGAAEQARQRALLQDDVAALGGGGGAGGVGGGGGGPSAAVLDPKEVALVSAFVAAANKIESVGLEIGKAIGEMLVQTQKQNLELTQAIQLNTQAVERSLSQFEQHYKNVTGGNPLAGTGVLDTTLSLEQANQKLKDELADLTKNRAGDFVARHLSKNPLSAVMEDVSSDSKVSSLEEQIAENQATIDRNRAQLSAIGGRMRGNFTQGGLLAQELDIRGIEHRAIPAGMTLDYTGASLYRQNLGSSNDEYLKRLVQIQTESNPERSNRTVQHR